MVEMQTGKLMKCLFQLPNAKISSSDKEMFRKSHKPIRSFSVGTGLTIYVLSLRNQGEGEIMQLILTWRNQVIYTSN